MQTISQADSYGDNRKHSHRLMLVKVSMMRTIAALHRMNALCQARYNLAQCNDWVDTARLLSQKEYSNAQALEWKAMKEEVYLEQVSHRLTITSSTTRRM